MLQHIRLDSTCQFEVLFDMLKDMVWWLTPFSIMLMCFFCAGWFNKQPIVNDQRGALWETCSDAHWLIVRINITCSTLADTEKVFWMVSLKTLCLTDKKNLANKHWWTIKDGAQQWVPTLVPKAFFRFIFSRGIKKKKLLRWTLVLNQSNQLWNYSHQWTTHSKNH